MEQNLSLNTLRSYGPIPAALAAFLIVATCSLAFLNSLHTSYANSSSGMIHHLIVSFLAVNIFNDPKNKSHVAEICAMRVEKVHVL